MPPVRWVRSRSKAERTDGYLVDRVGSDWGLFKDGALIAKTHSKDEAILYCDSVVAIPDGWQVEDQIWTSSYSASWTVRRIPGRGYGVFRNGERACVLDFQTPDRARRWAEIRLDRSDEAALRGPAPRQGKRASDKLPDVRATSEEKAAAAETVKRLGISYSEFVRASLLWAVENVLDTETATWRVERPERGVPRFVSTP
jgi:hypothetical protein